MVFFVDALIKVWLMCYTERPFVKDGFAVSFGDDSCREVCLLSHIIWLEASLPRTRDPLSEGNSFFNDLHLITTEVIEANFQYLTFLAAQGSKHLYPELAAVWCPGVVMVPAYVSLAWIEAHWTRPLSLSP